MKYINNLLIYMLVFFMGLSTTSVYAQSTMALKKRVVVFSFDDKSGTEYRWWGGKSVGEGMSDMLLTELVKSGKYVVIEREHLQKIMEEKNLNNAYAYSSSNAIDIGRVLGAEIAICGAVTEFGYKSRKSGIHIKRTDIGFGKNSAVAGMDVRIIDINTGEILFAENVHKKKSVPSGYIGIKDFGIGSENEFDDTMVGKVTRKAIQEIVGHIGKNAKKAKWQAKVITVKDHELYINSGLKDGVMIGGVLAVYRTVEELIDPDTGMNLGAIEKEVGTIKVTDNNIGEGKASLCMIVSGDQFLRGDVVRVSNKKVLP